MSCPIKYNQISLENDVAIRSSSRARSFDNIDERVLLRLFPVIKNAIFVRQCIRHGKLAPSFVNLTKSRKEMEVNK